MESEEFNQSKEVRRQQIVEELQRLRNSIGDSSENEIRFQYIQALEKELYELDPPPLSK